MRKITLCLLGFLPVLLCAQSGAAAVSSLSFSVALSETVTVDTSGGTPALPLDIGGQAREALYTGGTGSNTLTFVYTPQAGDVDLDGITLTSPLVLHGAVIRDVAGNNAALTFTAPDTSGIKLNYPSLSLDFIADADGRYTMNGTSYDTLPAFLTATGGSFTRASIATYFDSSGVLQTASANIPRFDYDPVTHVAKGFLVEESRTNLILQSGGSMPVSNWSTTPACSTPANIGSTTAPNGSSVPVFSMDTFGCFYQDVTVTSGTPVTHSIWIKANQAATVGFRNPGQGTAVTTSTSINLTTQWQRFTLTSTAITTTSRFLIDNRTINGFGVSGLQVSFFGAQAEQGSFVTSYIPTTTAAVTRATDNLSFPVGSWFSSSAGTLSSTYSSTSPLGTSTRVASLNNGGSTNVFQLANASAGVVLSQKAVAGTIFNSTGPSYVANTQFKAAASFDATGNPLAVAGTLYNNSNAGIPIGMTKLDVGMQNVANALNGWISVLRYYPVRVSNSQLQLLSQ